MNNLIKVLIKSDPTILSGVILGNKIKIKQHLINDILGEINSIKKFVTAKVAVKDGYLNIIGKASIEMMELDFSQNLYLDKHISLKSKSVSIRCTDAIGKNSNKAKNIVVIDLNKFNGIKEYIVNLRDMNIIKELSLDSIEAFNGSIKLTSSNKLELTIKEEFFQKILNEEIVEKQNMIEYLHIFMRDGYLNVKGKINIPELQVEFNKDFKITKANFMKDEYIEIEIDDFEPQENIDDGIKAITCTLYLNKIKAVSEVLDHPVVKGILEKFALTDKHEIRCIEDQEAIVIYKKGIKKHYAATSEAAMTSNAGEGRKNKKHKILKRLTTLRDRHKD